MKNGKQFWIPTIIWLLWWIENWSHLKYYSQSRRFFSSFIFLVCWGCNFILFYVLCKKFFIWKITLLINFCMTRKPIQMYMRVQKLNKLFCRHENSWNVFFVEKYISINISNIWWTCYQKFAICFELFVYVLFKSLSLE